MRDMIRAVFSALLLAIATSLLPQRGHAQKVVATDCASSVHAIIARGQGPGDDLDVMVQLQDMILQQVPGSTSLGLPYNHGGANLFNDVHFGALMIQDYVNEYSKSCPGAKIALIGYSLGAVTTMNAVCGTSSLLLAPVQPMDPSLSEKVIAVIAYGDETYVPFQPWNTGSCKVGLGQFPRLNPRSCDPFAASIQNYCDYGDYQCCSLIPWDNNAAHHAYIQKYSQDVVDFVKDRLEEKV